MKGIMKVILAGNKVLSVLVSLFFIVIGIVALVIPKDDEMVTVNCTIVELHEVTEQEHSVTNETSYVLVDYTDMNGAKHESVRYDGYDSKWDVGQEIELRYLPDDPEALSSTTPVWVIGMIAIAVGVLSLGFPVFNILRRH